MAGDTLTLESLIVKISIDGVQQLEAAQKKVSTAVDSIFAKLQELEGVVGAAAGGMEKLAAAVGTLAAGLPALETAAATTAIGQLVLGLQGIQSGNLVGSVQQLTESLTRLSGAPFELVGTKIGNMATALMDSRFYSDNFNKVITNLKELGTAFSSISQGISGLSVTFLKELSGAIKELGTGLLGASLHFKRARTAAANLEELGKSLGGLSALDMTKVKEAGEAIGTAMSDIGSGLSQANLHYVSIVRSLPVLKQLIETMEILGKVSIDPAKFTDIRAALTNLFGGTALKTVLADSNIDLVHPTNVINNLYRLALSLKMFSKLGSLPDVSAILEGLFGKNQDLANLLKGSGFDAAVTGIVNTFRNLTLALRGLEKLDIGTLGANLNAIAPLLTQFTSSVIGISLSTVDSIALTLGKLATALRGLSKITPDQIKKLIKPLETLLDSLANTPNITAVGETVQWLGKLRGALVGMAAVKGDKIRDLAGPIQSLFTALTGANAPLAADAINQLRRLGTVLYGFRRVSATNVSGLDKPLADLFNTLSSLTLPQMGAMSDTIYQLGKLINSLRRLTAITPDVLNKTGLAIKGFFAQLNSIVLTPNMQAATSMFSRLGNAARNLVNYHRMAGSGGGIPPVVANITNSVNNLPPALNKASSAAGNLHGKFRDMLPTMATLGGSFNTFRLSMLGGVAYGISLFAKLDDGIVRVLNHMREWEGSTTYANSKAVLEQGVANLAMSSRTGMTDLVSGLDRFASQGMNAAMAVEAMGKAEAFAVAGHMKMEEATKQLIYLQNNLGMTSSNVEKHFANMTRLSDLFVGVAPMVGASTKQFTEAFGDKFISSMRVANVSLEDAIALQGVYALRGVMGAQASDMSARALRELSLQSIAGGIQWDNLGVSVYEAGGKMRNIGDIIKQLDHRFGSMATMQKWATMVLMGFENRTISAIIPLTGMSKEFEKLKKGIGGIEDITKLATEALRQDFMGQISRLSNQAMVAGVAIGRTLAPALAYLADGLGTLLQGFMGLNPAMRNLIIGAGLLYTLFVPALALIFTIGKLLAGPFIWAGKAIWMMGVLGYQTFTSMYRAASWFGSKMLQVWDYIYAKAERVLTWLWKNGSNAFYSLASVTFTIVKSSIFGVIHAVQGLLWALNKVRGFLFGLLTDFTGTMRAIGSALGSMALSLLSGMFSALMNVVLFVATLVLWIPIIAAGIALVATTLVSVGQLFGAALVGAKSLWDSIRDGAGKASLALAEGVHDAIDMGIRTWDKFKGSIRDGFDQFVVFAKLVAGFFWNFQKNMEIISRWLGENWRQVAEDVGKAFAAVLENTTRNFLTMGATILKVGGETFSSFWNILRDYGTAGLSWLKDQWENLWHDLGHITKAFLKAFLSNFSLTMVTMLRLLDNATDVFAGGKDKKGKIIQDYLTDLQGVGEYLPGRFRRKSAGTQWKTDWGLLENVMGGANVSAMSTLQSLWNRVFGEKGMIEKSVISLVPLLNGFVASPIWKALFAQLETALPPDFMKQISQWLRNPMEAIPEGLGEFGNMTGKQGTGFNFKQISETRYMIGGPVAEALDYQQLVALQAINVNTARIAAHLGNIVGQPKPAQLPWLLGP